MALDSYRPLWYSELPVHCFRYRFGLLNVPMRKYAGPNLGLSCIQQFDAAPFFENYAELYFDTKHLRKVLNWGCW